MKKIKNTIESSMKKGRKKGAIMVELIAAIPIFFLILWAIMNIMMMLMASNQLNEAAYEAGRSVAVEMRGQEGDVVPGTHTNNIDTEIHLLIDNSVVIQMYKDGNKNIPKYAYTKTDCDALVDDKSNRNVICAYNESYESVPGKTQERIVTKIRSAYILIGDWIPGADDWLTVNARSVVQKELPDRYQYAQ